MCSYMLRAGDIMHVPALRCVSLFFRLLSLLSVLTLALSQSTTLDLNTVALESSEPSVNNGMDQTITQASSVRAGSTSLSLSLLQDSDLVTERKTGLALSDLIIPRASGSLESLPIARDEMSSNVDSWFSGDDGILTSPPIFQMMTAVTSLSDGISVNPSEVSNSFQTSVLSTVTQSTQDSVTAAFNMTPSFKSASDIATDTYVFMETSSVQSSPLFLENKTSHFGSSSFDINLISSVYEISISQNQSVSDVSFSVKLNLSTSVSFDGMVTMETISPTFLPVPSSSESIDQHSADRSSVFVSMDTEVLSISSSGADIFTQSLPGTESSYQQQQSQSATHALDFSSVQLATVDLFDSSQRDVSSMLNTMPVMQTASLDNPQDSVNPEDTSVNFVDFSSNINTYLQSVPLGTSLFPTPSSVDYQPSATGIPDDSISGTVVSPSFLSVYVSDVNQTPQESDSVILSDSLESLQQQTDLFPTLSSILQTLSTEIQTNSHVDATFTALFSDTEIVPTPSFNQGDNSVLLDDTASIYQSSVDEPTVTLFESDNMLPSSTVLPAVSDREIISSPSLSVVDSFPENSDIFSSMPDITNAVYTNFNSFETDLIPTQSFSYDLPDSPLTDSSPPSGALVSDQFAEASIIPTSVSAELMQSSIFPENNTVSVNTDSFSDIVPTPLTELVNSSFILSPSSEYMPLNTETEFIQRTTVTSVIDAQLSTGEVNSTISGDQLTTFAASSVILQPTAVFSSYSIDLSTLVINQSSTFGVLDSVLQTSLYLSTNVEYISASSQETERISPTETFISLQTSSASVKANISEATLDIISTTSSGISDVSTITPTSTLTVAGVTSVLVENATSSSTPVPTPANNVTSTPTPTTNVTSTPATNVTSTPTTHVTSTPTTNVTSTPATNVTSTPSSVTMSPTPDSECPSIQVNVTEEQYLVTELIIDSNEKITNCSMEAKMALVISAAFAKANTTTVETRKKRATEVAGVTVQMVSLNRTGNDVKLVYYVVRDGQVVDPTLVSQVMGYLHEMEVAILLGYVVKSVGKPYIQPVVYREDPKYWIIGVVLGGIVVLIGIIWCILFIYIKACRPSKKPNAENGTFDDTNDLEVKVDLDKNKPQLMKMTPSKQGVDIVRTEVGLAEQSRSRTQKLGSSSPPKNGPVISEKQPQTKRPINRHEKSPTKEKYRTEAYDSEASSNGTYHSERADDKQLLPPRNMKRPPGRGRSNSRGRKSAKSTDRPISAPRSRSRTKSPDFSDADISVRAGTFENVPKMSSSRDSPVKLRSTVHHVKLPPLVQQPLVAERPEDVQREKQEIDDTLQQKADIERWRNKQRQRSRKSARKKSRHPVGDSKEQRRAYMKAQEAINSVLDTDRPDDLRTHHSPKKSPKRRNGDVSLNSREPVPNWGNVESDSEIDKHSDRPEEALESARLRMHDLLDDAFALIAPLSRIPRNKVGPAPMSQVNIQGDHSHPQGQGQNSHARNHRHTRSHTTPSTTEGLISNGDVSSSQIPPGHTPMQVAVKPRDASGSIGWSPYSAADEAAVIHQQNQATMPPVGSVATPILGKLPNTNVPNENKGKYYATESPAPIVIRTSRIDPYTSVEMSSRLLNPAARSGHMTPPERDIISQPGTTNRRDYPTSLPDPLLRSQRMAISDPSVLQAGGPVEDGTDEQDVIYRSMKAGSSSEPLVKSLRQELERLSQRAGAHNAGHNSKGHESYPHV